MSRVQEIENAVEQLPPEDFSELAAWIDRKREIHNTRDHGAFLNSYAPGDEGLYDDAATR
jgi:predicted nucleotidyltransferase